jgi:hypothetical protein
MKNIVAGAAGIILSIAVAICVAPADQPTSSPSSRPATAPSTRPDVPVFVRPAPEAIEQTAKALCLTREQTAKVRELTIAQWDFAEAFLKENGEKMAELRREGGGRAVEASPLVKPLMESHTTYHSKLAEVLDKDQLEFFTRMLMLSPGPRTLHRMIFLKRRLELTADQQKLADPIERETWDAMIQLKGDMNGQQRIAAAAFERFATTVLTDEQRAKLKEMDKAALAASEPSSKPSGQAP